MISLRVVVIVNILDSKDFNVFVVNHRRIVNYFLKIIDL